MIGAVVLAAGRSERMGTQKLLLPLRGKPIITGIVDELLRAPISPVVVVVGRDAPQIEAALAGRQVAFAKNPDSASDMLGSVRCGLRALPESCEGILVVLGDQPGLTTGLVESLIAVFRAPAGKRTSSIVVPTHQGRRGHPLLFASKFRDEVLTRHNGVGLRGLLAVHSQAVGEVPVAASGLLADVDSPADYQRLLRGGSQSTHC